jgi:anaphase-promoting complex subunit 2
LVPNLVHKDVDFIQKLSSNPIQLLITTCKSKKAFREEYRRFLATNLLATKNYNIDQELMLLEVLKRNFGAQRFHECDVMIKDIDEGKRVDKMIHDKTEDLTTNFHGVILSKHYWPEMKDTDAHVKVPDKLAVQMDTYGTTYKSIKSNRKLSWLPALAKANVDVEIGGQVINVDLSPWGSRILSLFERNRKFDLGAFCKSVIISLNHILSHVDQARNM